MAYAALGPGTDLLGWPEGAQPSDAEEAAPARDEDPTEETSTGPPSTTSASASPDSPPDPAFDKLLPTLRQRTSAPIVLPTQLPNVLKNAAIDASSASGDQYAVGFFHDPPKDVVVQAWSRSEGGGTLRVAPTSASESNEYFEATSVEEAELPDGTEATLRRMEPVKSGGTQGPYWEGQFDEHGYRYTLTTISDPNGTLLRQALSSMVPVPRPKENEARVPTGGEAELRQAVKDYYEAVDREDWDYTYENLYSATRRAFTGEEEWKKKNQWMADNDQLRLRSMDVSADIPAFDPMAEVKVERTFEDGSSAERDTYFVYEGGSWKHHFTQEERNLFEPGTPFEEWVGAQ